MDVGMGGDLGQMGDAQDLMPARQCPQAATDRIGAPPADSRVDLVEDQRRGGVGRGEDLLDRKGDPAQLPTRGDPGQGARRLAHVRSEAEDHLVDAAGIERQRVAADLDSGLVAAGRPATQGDLEPGAGEAELLEGDRDRRREPFGGLGAQTREGAGGPGHLGQEHGVLGESPSALAFDPTQALRLHRHRLTVGQHRRLVVAVAPLEGEDQRQALLEAGHGGGIVIEVVDQGPNLGGHVVDLGVQSGQALGQRVEARVEARQLTRLPPGGRDALACGAALPDAAVLAASLAHQRRVDRRAAASDRLAMAGGPQASLDLVDLADPHARRGNLGGFVLRKIEATDELAGIDGQLGQGCPVRPPALHRSGNGLTGHPGAAVGVEQVALDALVEEPLLIVLAVDLDQPTSGLGQSRGGDRLVVEPGRRASARLHLADDDERLWQPFEEGLHPGPLRPVADETRGNPRSEGQAQGVDQQALARAGLAGDDVEAGPELETNPVDQAQVGDGQLEQAPRRFVAHDGSSSTLWRSRSQNGIAPAGSTNRIERAPADTSTTSPTAMGRSSRPSMLTSASIASTTRAVTVWLGLTTTERIAER
jgi:hypothetical protein